MSSSSPGPDAERPAPAFPQKIDAGRLAVMRELVEGTSRSYHRIGEQLGVSAATISRYARQQGWQRPPGAAVPARPARIDNHRERVTERLWKLTERHAAALEEQPIELAQRSLQPLARLTRVLGDMEKQAARAGRADRVADAIPTVPERRRPDRNIHELRDELAAHLERIEREEQAEWEKWHWWFEGGAGI